MVDLKAKPTPVIRMKIDGVNIPDVQIHKFEWRSFLNGGYEIHAEIMDQGHAFLNRIPPEKKNWWQTKYLRNARKEPIEIEFKIGYPGGSEFETCNGNFKKAILSELLVEANPSYSMVEIRGIDPPSWFLSAGKSDGKVFTGKISEVIKKVVSESTNGRITAKVSETKDYNGGKWPMMRQDPYTFIFSLVDWSSKTLKNEQSSWMIGVDDKTIYIEDQKDYLARKKHIADYVNTGAKGTNDIINCITQNSTLLSAYQARLTTQGISAVSGKFLDKQVQPKETEIKDENTKNKLNAKVDKTMAFDKTKDPYSTSIIAVPELSGGELGLKYEDWIGGKPQQFYLDSLPMIMRCNFTVLGDYRFFDNNRLGVSTIKVTWKKSIGDEIQDHYLHGHWIVYGFVHRYDNKESPLWTTDLYVYRIEHDAAAQSIP